MNKRAQAQIITTVLIILLVLAAVVIVWQVISATVQEGSEGIAGATECMTTQLEIKSVNQPTCSFTTNSLCLENKTFCETCDGGAASWLPGSAVVQRTSGGSGDIGVKVLVDGKMQIITGAGDLGPLETETINFDDRELPDINKVEVAVFLNQGTDKERTCEPSDTREI